MLQQALQGHKALNLETVTNTLLWNDESHVSEASLHVYINRMANPHSNTTLIVCSPQVTGPDCTHHQHTYTGAQQSTIPKLTKATHAHCMEHLKLSDVKQGGSGCQNYACQRPLGT